VGDERKAQIADEIARDGGQGDVEAFLRMGREAKARIKRRHLAAWRRHRARRSRRVRRRGRARRRVLLRGWELFGFDPGHRPPNMQTTPPDPDDLIDRLDAGEPPRSPEESAARAPYERLLARIRSLEDAPPAGWEERAMTRWARHRRRARVSAVGFTVLFSIAALLVLWWTL
jgi:hypothetical protein